MNKYKIIITAFGFELAIPCKELCTYQQAQEVVKLLVEAIGYKVMLRVVP